MDTANLNYKNQLNNMESKIDELRLDLYLKNDIDLQIEDLHREIKNNKQDEEYYCQMKNNAIIKYDNVSMAIYKMETEAQIYSKKANNKKFRKANLRRLKKDPFYCKLKEERDYWTQRRWMAEKYEKYALTRNERIINNIVMLEFKKYVMCQ